MNNSENSLSDSFANHWNNIGDVKFQCNPVTFKIALNIVCMKTVKKKPYSEVISCSAKLNIKILTVGNIIFSKMESAATDGSPTVIVRLACAFVCNQIITIQYDLV